MALVGHISGSSQSNSVIGISGSVIVANRPNSLFPSLPGTDVTFFVSGAINDTATSVFGGKLVVSGGIKTTTISGSGDLNVGGDLRIAGDLQVDGNDIKSSTGATVIEFTGSNVVIPGDLTVNGTTVTVSSSNLVIFDQLIGIGFESGSVARTNGDRGLIGGLATGNNASIFWDNSETEFAVVRTDSTPDATSVNVISYADLHVDALTGSLVKVDALTGSLTKLIDGSDYLRAGTNITLATGSAGEITISAAGAAAPIEYFYSTTAGSIYTTGSAAFKGAESIDSPADKGANVFFYVSGANDDTASSVFGGKLVVSGGTQHLDQVQITGSLLTNGVSMDLQGTNVNISTNVLTSSINIGAVGKLTDVVVAGDGKIQLLANPGGSPGNNPPDGSIQLLAKSTGGVGFNPAGGEIVLESANGFVVNTNGHMTLQMNSPTNETLQIFSSNAFSSTPNIQIRSDGSSAVDSIDIVSHNGGGISIGSNSSYDTGDINIGTENTQRSINIGTTTTEEQYVLIGSYVGTSTTTFDGLVSVRGGEYGIVDSPLDKGTDVFFYVSGSTDGASMALFGGCITASGSLKVDGDVVLGDSSADVITFNGQAGTDLLPSSDMAYNLGSPSNRWANVYTGDLHLRNDRGNWTVIEEDDYLSIRNNKTGKMFKFVLEPV